MADGMWSFLEKQKSSPEALKNAVDTLIGFAKGKDYHGEKNRQLDSLEMVKFTIICEAAALVLSDDWQAFMECRKGGCRDAGKDKSD